MYSLVKVLTFNYLKGMFTEASLVYVVKTRVDDFIWLLRYNSSQVVLQA